MVALSACDSLGLGENESEAEAALQPVREALASEGSVADADRALEAKDYQRAYNILRQHLIRNPTDDEAKIRLAQTYLGRNEGRNAQTVLDSLSDEVKDTPKAKMVRGLALLVIGERAQAEEHLAAALADDPSLWQAANGLGLIHDGERRWDDAEKSYRLALEQNNDGATVHNNLGYSYLLQGRVDDAIGSFTTALSHEPELDVARANLRLALAAKGRYTDAAAGSDRASLPQVLNNIGYVAMLRGDFESAGIFFQRAIAESPVYYDTAEENLERLQALTGKSETERTGTIRSLGN